MRQASLLLLYGAYMHESPRWDPVLALSPNLAYLATIVEHGSFAGAAAHLKMTPSTLSRAIRRLEHQLDIELAVRNGRSIDLTKAGQLLAGHARLAADQVRQGVREAGQAGSRRVIRIGLLQSLGADYVPAVVGQFVAGHPEVQFFFREDSGAHLEQMLLDGEIDIALLAPAPVNAAFTSTVLFEQRIDLVVAAESPWAQRGVVRLADLADENFIMTESGFGVRDLVDKLFEAAGYQPKTILETTNLTMATALAAAGVGMALAPPMPDGVTGVARVPIDDPMARRDVAICRLSAVAAISHLREFERFVINHPSNARGAPPVR